MQGAYPAVEERLGTLIIEGQRQEVFVRSTPDTDGTWHNALLFRRDGKLSAPGPVTAGVDWHVPPGVALMRAQEMQEQEQIQLFRLAQRPTRPLF
ncbi:MAG: hypothetical protein ACLFRX_04655 [Gemmatimonadota bacterium]